MKRRSKKTQLVPITDLSSFASYLRGDPGTSTLLVCELYCSTFGPCESLIPTVQFIGARLEEGMRMNLENG